MHVCNGIIYPSRTALIILIIFKPSQIPKHFEKFVIIYRLGVVQFVVKLITFFLYALSVMMETT